MNRKLGLTCVLVLAAFLSTPQIASAAGVVSPGAKAGPPSSVEHVQFRHCRAWYRECRARWGGGWRFRRCLARHGC
jgi:hypothetical protein